MAKPVFTAPLPLLKSFLIAFLFICSNAVWGQADLVRWNNINLTPSIIESNITASNITPVGIGALTHNDQNNNTQFFRTELTWPNPSQNGGSLDTSKYIEFSVTPDLGYQLDLTNFNFTHRSQGTGNYQIRYSKNDFNNYYTAVSNTALNTTFTDVSAAITSTNPILPGETLKIRIYFYNTWNVYEFKRVARKNQSNNHTETPRIMGTVSAVIPTSPVAVNDNASITQNTATNINILANDTPNGTLSAIMITQQPAHGTVTVNGV